MTPTHRRNREQLIGVLVPVPLADRPQLHPAPIPALPVRRPVGAENSFKPVTWPFVSQSDRLSRVV
jgi:hypothetical protein